MIPREKRVRGEGADCTGYLTLRVDRQRYHGRFKPSNIGVRFCRADLKPPVEVRKELHSAHRSQGVKKTYHFTRLVHSCCPVYRCGPARGIDQDHGRRRILSATEANPTRWPLLLTARPCSARLAAPPKSVIVPWKAEKARAIPVLLVKVPITSPESLIAAAPTEFADPADHPRARSVCK